MKMKKMSIIIKGILDVRIEILTPEGDDIYSAREYEMTLSWKPLMKRRPGDREMTWPAWNVEACVLYSFGTVVKAVITLIITKPSSKSVKYFRNVKNEMEKRNFNSTNEVLYNEKWRENKRKRQERGIKIIYMCKYYTIFNISIYKIYI